MYIFDFGFDGFKKICVLDKAKLIFQEYNINVKATWYSFIINRQYHLIHIDFKSSLVPGTYFFFCKLKTWMFEENIVDLIKKQSHFSKCITLLFQKTGKKTFHTETT